MLLPVKIYSQSFPKKYVNVRLLSLNIKSQVYINLTIDTIKGGKFLKKPSTVLHQ